jgi:chromosome partitioning protein
MNSLAAADYLLIALQCEYLALEGLGQILKVVDRLHEAKVNERLQVGGVIMTMFDVRTNLSRQVVDEVRTHLPDQIFNSVIPRTIRLSEAPSFGKTIFEYDPTSPGSTAYRNAADELIQRFKLDESPTNG